MYCLKDCLEAIRLSTSELLTTAAHAHCTSAECTSPGLDGLSKRLPRYVDFLTRALFRKKRDEDDWFMVFYSLCIQSYVRRGLVELERSWKTTYDEMEPILGCRNYLHTAVGIFSQISAQNKRRLAMRIENSPTQSSTYVGVSSLGNLSMLQSSQPVPGTNVLGRSWDQWREEGIEKHLRRIFEMGEGLPIVSDELYDSDATTTIVSGTVIGSRRNRASDESLQQLNPSKRQQVAVSVAVRSKDEGSESVRTPSVLSSGYSMTSLADESDMSSLAGLSSNASTCSFQTAYSGYTEEPWRRGYMYAGDERG